MGSRQEDPGDDERIRKYVEAHLLAYSEALFEPTEIYVGVGEYEL